VKFAIGSGASRVCISHQSDDRSIQRDRHVQWSRIAGEDELRCVEDGDEIAKTASERGVRSRFALREDGLRSGSFAR
jgi:hypothetical protein